MPTVEIDEEEVRANRVLRGVVSKILSNPKAKLLVQQAQKMVDPGAVTPELDQQGAIAEPVAAMQKRLDDMEKELKTRDAEAEKNAKLASIGTNIEAGKAKLRREGWTDEGIAGVEKIMDEKGILDPEIAAAYFEKQHPPQNVAAPSGTGAWNFLEQPTDGAADLKALIENKGEGLVVDKLAREALNEVRGQSRR